jgi:nucleotide-binding universal stress UspA family protein
MNKILFPASGSNKSITALHYACLFAKQKGVGLVILHTYSLPVFKVSITDFEKENFKNATLAQHQQLIDDYLKSYQSLPYAFQLNELVDDIRFEEAEVAQGIINATRAEEIGMVIMGTEGAAAQPNGELGSKTYQVIQKAHCPVLAVPTNALIEMPSHILCGLDYQQDTRYIISAAMSIADLFQAEVTFLYIAPAKRSPEQEEKFHLHYDKAKYYLSNLEHWKLDTIDGEDVVEELWHYVQKNNIDLIALETRVSRYLDHIYKESVTRKMALHTNIPLFAYHFKL